MRFGHAIGGDNDIHRESIHLEHLGQLTVAFAVADVDLQRYKSLFNFLFDVSGLERASFQLVTVNAVVAYKVQQD